MDDNTKGLWKCSSTREGIWKILPWNNQPRTERAGTEKVSATSLMKESLFLLLYLFIYLLYNYVIIFITKL